jgi:predicted DNA-binding transcriptional regulator YafY
MSWYNVTFEILEPEVNKEEPLILRILQTAISMRQKVEFVYHDIVRVVEPYELGKNSQGDWIMRGFQTDGDGIRKGAGHWKHFRVDRMSNIDLTGEFFIPRDEYYELPPSWIWEPWVAV